MFLVEFLHIIALLLEQGQNIKIHRPGSFLLLVSWFLVIFTAGSAYKEYLCSTLSAILLPKVPQTVSQIVESGFPVVTFSTLFGVSPGSEESMIKNSIDLLALSAKKGTFKLSVLEEYLALKSRTKLAKKSTAVFFHTIFNNEPVDLEGAETVIPKTFVILDTAELVDEIKMLTLLFGKSVFQIGSQDLGIFRMRSQWIFHRNFFLQLANPFLEGIFESGINNRWKYYQLVSQKFWFLDNMKKLIKAYERKKYGGNYLKYSRSHLSFLFNQFTFDQSNPEEPISLDFFLIFIKMFLVLLLISIMILIFEVREKIIEKCTYSWDVIRIV